MKNVQRIIKKEMDKIFKFPRIIFSTIILPGLLIFGIYAFMGMSMNKEVDKQIEYRSNIYFINSPAAFDEFVNASQAKIKVTKSQEPLADLLDKVKAGDIDAVVVFSDNFESKYFTDEALVTIYSNLGKSNSTQADSIMQQLINAYQQVELKKQNIDTNIFAIASNNTITDNEKNTGQVLAMLLPMFIMTFVFAGALAIGADAIAGEKERGTLATLLMAPIKRNEIIIGKIISTAIISILSAMSSFVGVIASFPFSKNIFQIDTNISYSFTHYAQIFIILLVLGLLSSSLILIASTFAKSTKEATSYAMPLYILAILASTISMFNNELPKEVLVYFIPIYNMTLGLKGIFTFDLTGIQFLYIIGSNIIVIVLTIFLLIRMFKSEKVMFNR
jgi:sodium transport system permease protein